MGYALPYETRIFLGSQERWRDVEPLTPRAHRREFASQTLRHFPVGQFSQQRILLRRPDNAQAPRLAGRFAGARLVRV